MNKKFIASIFILPASEEDMVNTIKILINQMVKEMWLKLQSDVFDAGLFAEFCDFCLEHPELNLIEIDRKFREEWDI